MADLALPSSDNGATSRLRDWRGSRQHVGLYALALSLVAIAFALPRYWHPHWATSAHLFLVPPVLIAGVLGGWGRACWPLEPALHLYATPNIPI